MRNHTQGVLDILDQLLSSSITKNRAVPAIQVIIPATDDSPFGMGQLSDMRKSATHLGFGVRNGPPWPS